MKEIELTQGKVALVDDEDYEFLMQWDWYAYRSGKKVYFTYYSQRNIKINEDKRSTLKMHRVIMGVTDPKLQVDHIDGNSLNNQRSNLRICTSVENCRNSKKRTGASSQYKGVSWHKVSEKWIAHITLGSFKTEEDAALAYNEAAIRYHGKFAGLNVISSA